MDATPIRPAYSSWPAYNQRLRDAVAGLSAEQLAIAPSPDRWPLWATLGHVACQRVFWLCDFAGVPGKESTPFQNAAFNCPGDDDLENVLGPTELADALDSTFDIVERCLDTWSFASLTEKIVRADFGPDWVHTRGAVIQRVFAHDMYHAGQVVQTLGISGWRKPDLWG